MGAIKKEGMVEKKEREREMVIQDRESNKGRERKDERKKEEELDQEGAQQHRTKGMTIAS